MDFGKKRPSFYTKDDGPLKLHPGSVNALQQGAIMHKYVARVIVVCEWMRRAGSDTHCTETGG